MARKTIDEQLQQMAVAMVMSDLPEEGAWDLLMDTKPYDPVPEEFVVWEPYENWEVAGLQELVGDLIDSLVSARGVTDEEEPEPYDPDPAKDEYTVLWEIQVCAETYLGAAKEARASQLDPDTLATHFEVTKHTNPAHTMQFDVEAP